MDKSTQTEEEDFFTPRNVHAKSSDNYDAIQKSDKVGCFYCKEIFDASLVEEYSRYYSEAENDDDSIVTLPLETHGGDALCPKCGIDSVLPDATQDLSKELLEEMKQIYFKYT